MSDDEQQVLDLSVRDHPLARTSDPDTSHLAELELREREGTPGEIRAGTHRHCALACFAVHGPLTAEDVKVLTGIDGIWKRVSDLKAAGLVAGEGVTQRSRQGREAEVYAITEAGWQAMAKLGRYK